MTEATKEVRVWDLFVRVFHWSLVLAFTVAYVTGEEDEGIVALVHEWAGYAVLGLIAARTIWGFIGTRHARFTDFVFPPAKVLAYARALIALRAPRYLGHNPLGGTMVIALLLSITATGVTGYLLLEGDERGRATIEMPSPLPTAHANDREEHERKEARDEDHEEHNGRKEREDEWLEEAHELLANVTLTLVFLHVLGVLLSSALHRENLVRAMVTGRKRAGTPAGTP